MKRLTAVTVLTLLLAGSVLEGDNSFYRVLASKPNATFEDAVRAFLDLGAGTDVGSMSFDKQAAELADAKIIRKSWAKRPEERLTRGRTAYLVCRVCRIKGGITMRILGPSERYAFRECIFLGVWRGGNQRDYVTGGELMGVLKWAADYLDEHPKKMTKLQSAFSLAPAGKTGTAPRPFGPSAEEVETPVEGVAEELDEAAREAEPAEEPPESQTPPEEAQE